VIQADQQQCLPTVPGIYCNKRGIVKTQGHVVEVSFDTVTIDGVVVPITGTYNVGNGVNVTKVGPNDYIVNYPNGNTRFTSGPYYQNIYISATSGRQPTGSYLLFFLLFLAVNGNAGGVCTQLTGPNPTSKRALTPSGFCLSCKLFLHNLLTLPPYFLME